MQSKKKFIHTNFINLAVISESLRKVRTTARFLLGNLHDFDHNKRVPYNELQEVDQYMLNELYNYNNRVTSAYNDFAFNRGKLVRL